jgi:hypothetical protein
MSFRNGNRLYLWMRKLWPGWVIVFALLLSSCGSEQVGDPHNLAYSTDPDKLIIFADENTSPGGYAMGQECNHIPRLRIWGDGRTIYSDIRDGQRRVLVGQTSPEQIKAILQKLADLDYFANPPDDTFNGAGTGYRIGINLENGNHNSFWTDPNPNYQAVNESFDPSGLIEFSPQEGYLVIGPSLRKDLFLSPPVWPDTFGFRLSDPEASGRTVNGPALDFLWQAINNSLSHSPEFKMVTVFTQWLCL